MNRTLVTQEETRKSNPLQRCRRSQIELEDSDVFLLDSPIGLYIWSGSKAEASSVKFARDVAQRTLKRRALAYSKASNLSHPPKDVLQASTDEWSPLIRRGEEPPAFRSYFHGWIPWVVLATRNAGVRIVLIPFSLSRCSLVVVQWAVTSPFFWLGSLLFSATSLSHCQACR